MEERIIGQHKKDQQVDSDKDEIEVWRQGKTTQSARKWKQSLHRQPNVCHHLVQPKACKKYE